MAKEPIPVLVLLGLVRFDLRQALRSLVLPLLLLMQGLLDFSLGLLDSSQAGTNFLPLHMEVMVTGVGVGCTSGLNVYTSR